MRNWKEKIKEVKNSNGWKMAKAVAGGMAAIGGGALATYAVNKYGGRSTLKGLKAFCAGAGVFGLSCWASQQAQKATEKEMDSWLEATESVLELKDAINGVYYDESEDSKDDSDDEED